MSNVHDGHRKRLRERILKNGFDSLYSHELLEYVLFGAFPMKDTNALAHRLLARFGSVNAVFSASQYDLESVEGMGPASALFLKSYEYVFNVCSKTQDKKLIIKTLGDAKAFFIPYFKNKVNEELHVVLLDRSFILKRHLTLASPSVNRIYVDISSVMREIAKTETHAIIFAHNHPSGNATPSAQDIEFTSRYFTAIALAFNVSIAEHLIFAEDGICFSFRNSGLLQKMCEEHNKNAGAVLADNTLLGGF